MVYVVGKAAYCRKETETVWHWKTTTSVSLQWQGFYITMFRFAKLNHLWLYVVCKTELPYAIVWTIKNLVLLLLIWYVTINYSLSCLALLFFPLVTVAIRKYVWYSVFNINVIVLSIEAVYVYAMHL